MIVIRGFTPHPDKAPLFKAGMEGCNKFSFLRKPRVETRGAGFTLLELVIVIIIIGILSASGVWLMLTLIQSSVFIPNQLNMDMLAKQALDIMIEGDRVYSYYAGTSGAMGLRFSQSITSIQDNDLTFLNQDNLTIRYRLQANKLYRAMNGTEEVFPYYAAPGIKITVTGKDNKLFTYYDTNEAVTTNPADVRRIKISLIAKTGSGSFAQWEGQSEQSSSIAVKRMQ